MTYGYLWISPPLSKELYESALGFSEFSATFQEGEWDLGKLSLGRDPCEFSIKEIMEKLVEGGHSLYLNAIHRDDETGTTEWFGFNENVDCTHPTAILEEVRAWMPGGHVTVPQDVLHPAVFELLMIVDQLKSAPATERVRKLAASVDSVELASAMFDECYAMVSSDLACTTLHTAQWRVTMGALAALVLRVALNPEPGTPRGELEEYCFHDASWIRDLFPPTDEAVQAVVANLMKVADDLDRHDVDTLLRVARPSMDLYETSTGVQALMRFGLEGLPEGVAGMYLSQAVGSYANLARLLPRIAKIAADRGESELNDLAQCLSLECRENAAESFEAVAKEHPELVELADTFQARIDSGTW